MCPSVLSILLQRLVSLALHTPSPSLHLCYQCVLLPGIPLPMYYTYLNPTYKMWFKSHRLQVANPQGGLRIPKIFILLNCYE